MLSDGDEFDLPDDAYKSLLLYMSERFEPNLARHNGASYYTYLPELFDSYTDARRILLGLHNEIIPDMPSLSWLYKAYDSVIGVPDSLHYAYRTFQDLNLEDSLRHIKIFEELYDGRGHLDSDLRDFVAQINGPLEKRELAIELRYSAWLQTNINQYHRKARHLYANRVRAVLNEMIWRTLVVCVKHGMTFSLRPLLAMPSPFHNELLTLPTGYWTSDVRRFRTQANNMVADILYNDSDYKHAFNVRPRDIDATLSAGTTESEYRFWFKHNATAILSKDDDPSRIYALTPMQMIPLLFKIPSSKVGAFSYYQPLPMLMDKFVGFYTIDKDPTPMVTEIDREFQIVLRAVACIATGISICVANLDLGKGNRKPSWIQSPLTAGFINFFAKYQATVLQDMRHLRIGV